MRYLFKQKSVTLLELIIGMAILAIVVLSVAQLDLFSNASVMQAQRRTRLTNEASLAVEHITRNLKEAIGTVSSPAATNVAISADIALRFWVDSSGNFRRDSNDIERAYRWIGAAGNPGNRYLLRFCDLCKLVAGDPCTQCDGTNSCAGGSAACWGIIIARDVFYFGAPNQPIGTPVALQENFAELEIQTCYDPDESKSNCGTPDNPGVRMQARVEMPSYSTR